MLQLEGHEFRDLFPVPTMRLTEILKGGPHHRQPKQRQQYSVGAVSIDRAEHGVAREGPEINHRRDSLTPMVSNILP